jgi:hypothetical protein
MWDMQPESYRCRRDSLEPLATRNLTDQRNSLGLSVKCWVVGPFSQVLEVRGVSTWVGSIRSRGGIGCGCRTVCGTTCKAKPVVLPALPARPSQWYYLHYLQGQASGITCITCEALTSVVVERSVEPRRGCRGSFYMLFFRPQN